MGDYGEVFVAFDVAKLKNAVAVADAGRTGGVRYLGEIENTAEATAGWSPSCPADMRD